MLKDYEHNAKYYETDQMGCVHHSNYIRWMEEARVDLMDQMGCGYRAMEEAGVCSPVLEVNCRYKSMVRFGDTVAVQVTITRLTPAKMEVGYRITDAKTGELRAEGSTGHFFFDMAEQKPVALKRVMPELYQLFAQYKEG